MLKATLIAATLSALIVSACGGGRTQTATIVPTRIAESLPSPVTSAASTPGADSPTTPPAGAPVATGRTGIPDGDTPVASLPTPAPTPAPPTPAPFSTAGPTDPTSAGTPDAEGGKEDAAPAIPASTLRDLEWTYAGGAGPQSEQERQNLASTKGKRLFNNGWRGRTPPPPAVLIDARWEFETVRGADAYLDALGRQVTSNVEQAARLQPDKLDVGDEAYLYATPTNPNVRAPGPIYVVLFRSGRYVGGVVAGLRVSKGQALRYAELAEYWTREGSR